MSKTYLKIKIMSLAAEARIIRREEHKWPTVGPSGVLSTRDGLRLHRVGPVRDAARHAQLAYAFLRGRPYASVEAPNSEPFSFFQVAGNVARFDENWSRYRRDPKLAVADVEAWFAASQATPETAAVAA